MPQIYNKSQTIMAVLKNAMSSVDRVDIAVGFFYFSGFQALFDQLKNKKVRIVVNVTSSAMPVFLQNTDKEELYIRTSASSQPMSIREANEYITTHREN